MAEYIFNDHIKGDTFNELVFDLTVDGVAVDLTDVDIDIDFRTAPGVSASALSLGVETGITKSATTGRFSIDEQIINIPAGVYYYDIQFTYDTGKVKTYLEGTLTILQDVTYA